MSNYHHIKERAEKVQKKAKFLEILNRNEIHDYLKSKAVYDKLTEEEKEEFLDFVGESTDEFFNLSGLVRNLKIMKL